MIRDNFDHRYVHVRNFIGLVKCENADAIRQAATETGFNIEVRESVGSSQPRCISVWTLSSGRDHGPFWKRYEELVKAR